MAQELKINLIVNDDGTAVIKNFSDNAANNLKKVEGAGESMGGGFAKTWQGLAFGLNQGIQLFQQLVGAIEAPINAYMESEKSLLKMGMAMKNQGDFSRAALSDMEDFAAQIQKTTAYEDDATLAVMGNLKTYGLSNEQVKQATKAALDLATAKAGEGMTVEKASEIMGKSYMGISTGLKKLGIQVDETADKSQLFNTVMKQVNDRFGGSAQAELLTYAGQWKQLKNQWGDIQELLGLGLLKSIEAVMFGASQMGAVFWKLIENILSGIGWLAEKVQAFAEFVGMEKVANGLGAITDGLKAGANNAKEAAAAAISNADANYKNMMSFDKVSSAIDKMGIAGKRTQAIDEEAAKAAKKALQEKEAAIKQLTEAIRKQSIEVDGIGQTQYEKDMIRIESEKAEWVKKTGDVVQASIWEANEITKADQKAYDERIKQLLAESEIDLKLSRDKAAISEERSKAERELYKDIRGYEVEAHKESIKLIKEQAKKHKDLGVDEVAIEKWVAEETRKADYKKAQYSDNFFEGVRAGLKDIQAKTTSWGAVGIDAVKSFSSNAKTTVSRVFFDAYKGELKSASDYFTSFADKMVGKFTDSLSNMAVDAATNAITMNFSATWTAGAQAVLGAVGKVLGYAADWFFDSTGSGQGLVPGGYTGGYVQSGRIVPGYAYGGDSPANDTFHAMLSPGEYVVPRSVMGAIASHGQHGDTMLAHINPAEAALLKALGGAGTVNEKTGLPQFWGFSDLVNIFTGGVSGAVTAVVDAVSNSTTDDWLNVVTGGFHSAREDVKNGKTWEAITGLLMNAKNNVLARALDAFGTSLGTTPQRALNSAGIMPDDVYATNKKYTEEIAHFIGTLFIGGAGNLVEGGATAGSVAGTAAEESAAAITSDMLATNAYNEAIRQGATSAAADAAYNAAFTAAMKEAGQQAIANIALKAVTEFGKKWAINEVLKSSFSAESGTLGITSNGIIGGEGIGGLIKDFPSQMSGQYAFRALNGLDYVPRNKYPILADEGEAVLTKDEAHDWRSGINNTDLAGEMQSLLREMAELKVSNYLIAKYTGKMVKILDQFNVDGLPPERVYA